MATAVQWPWATDMAHLRCSHDLRNLAYSLYSIDRDRKIPSAGGLEWKAVQEVYPVIIVMNATTGDV